MPLGYDKFYIGTPHLSLSGQITRYKPFMLPSQAFEELRNLYVYREVIRKRPGALVMDTTQATDEQQLFTRLRINIGTTDANGDLAATVPGTVSKVGQMFSIGTVKYTVVNGAAGAQDMLQSDNGGITATYNTATGAYNFVGAAALTDVFFYPAEPVMHNGSYELDAINAEKSIVHDTQFAYSYTAGSGWDREAGGAGTAAEWTTSAAKDSYYFSHNFQGANEWNNTYYITNNVAADAMRYYDGTNWNAWGSLATTPISGTDYIITCQAIGSMGKRLLLFGTTEFTTPPGSTQVFRQRIRFSVPTDIFGPTNALSWINPGSGYVDLPTQESIIAIRRLKDIYVIACERSFYRLVETGNDLEPFLVEQIDDELGVESMNSLIGFDRSVIGFGTAGINASDGQGVQRVDEFIPDEIFDVSNANSGHKRVQGVRDYFNEMAYFTYNSFSNQTTYNLIWPTRFLIYDYINRHWAFADDSISALGYFWQQSSVDGRQLNFRSILAGNQQGWMFRLRDNVTRNSMSLQITDISVTSMTATITSVDHNLTNESYVYIDSIVSTNSLWSAEINGNIYQVTTTGTGTFTIELENAPGADTYLGSGTIERVSEPNLLSKEYNFYDKESQKVAFNQCNFLVDKTDIGEITVDFIPSASSLSLLDDATASGALLGTNILQTSAYTLVTSEQFQTRFWHSVSFGATGEYIQIRMFLTDTQLRNQTGANYTAFQDIQINGMIFYTTSVEDFA